MKKNSLLKAILIAFGIAVILSWIIPAGGYSSGTFTAGTTNPVGIINLFRLPVMTMQTFIQYTIVFLSIGALYGVLNKTGVYGNIVSGIAKKMERKRKSITSNYYYCICVNWFINRTISICILNITICSCYLNDGWI